MDARGFLKTYDMGMAIAVVLLGVFGVVMVYSSANSPHTPQLIVRMFGEHYIRQGFFVASGTLLMVAFSFINYRFISRFYVYIYALMLTLLVLALLIGADDATGTARWLWLPLPVIGPLSMMPSEFAKLFMIIALSKFLSINHDTFNKPLMLLAITASAAIPIFLVAIQPSLSAALVILSITLAIMFAAGLNARIILFGLAVVIPLSIIVWSDLARSEPVIVSRILADFQLQRLETFLYPIPSSDEFRQTEGSLAAIGAGGMTGLGFLQNPHVIHGHNDFIFAVIAAQFGFVGSISLLFVVFYVIIRLGLTAIRSSDVEGRLIAAGTVGMVIFETFFHVGVVTNILPNTGMPFPFVSYGGSMIWVHMIAVGICMNVNLASKRNNILD